MKKRRRFAMETIAMAAALGALPEHDPLPEPSKKKDLTDADRKRIAKAEAKRKRKAEKRLREGGDN